MTDNGKRILEAARAGGACVLGAGISNIPLTEFLLREGAKVSLRDARNLPEMLPEAREKIERLISLGAEFVSGEGYMENIEGAVIFRSPGIREDRPEIAQAVKGGAILSSETELFFELAPATIVGITGSDGKSTTTTVTSLILRELVKKRGTGGNVYVGGNLGTPLLPMAYEMTDKDFAVIELSSFQLQTFSRSAHAAAITNITPNHLNWHTDMAEYQAAKERIYKFSPCKMLVTNAKNEITAEIAKRAELPVTLFSAYTKPKCERALYLEDGYIIFEENEKKTELIKESDILLPGAHNRENYMTAAGLILSLGFDTADVISAIKAVATAFPGVEHRLEFVRKTEGVKVYNSSIDSSPTRTIAALSAFPDKENVVILGGYDKNIPYAPLAPHLCEKTRAVVLCGATKDKIEAALREYEGYKLDAPKIIKENDFEKAVMAALNEAIALDAKEKRLILSPASASFDMFPNFEVRGRRFKEIINSL